MDQSENSFQKKNKQFKKTDYTDIRSTKNMHRTLRTNKNFTDTRLN